MQSQRRLSSEEQALLREGRFGAADCLFRLEARSAEGIAAYEQLTRVYAGRVEGLLASTRLVLCYAQHGKTEKAQIAWQDTRDLLHRLTDDELKPTKRQQWEEWLVEQEKNLKPVNSKLEGQATPK